MPLGSPGFIALKSNISGREQMFPLEVTKFRRLWWQAVGHLQLAGVGPPHSLRHSRPSQDAISGARTLKEIRRRGRWASVKSVQRYSKAHSLVAARARVPEEVMAAGNAFWQNPERELCKALRHSPAAESKLARLILISLENGALTCPPRSATPQKLERAGELSAMTVSQLREISKQLGVK